MNIRKGLSLTLALFTSGYLTTTQAQSAACPANDTCLPCGQIITNAPSVAYEPQVTPVTNFMATSTCCKNLNNYFGGFYLGVGWGVGVVDWDIEVANPGVPGVNAINELDSDTRSYLLGVANVGFNWVLNYFSLGFEVGYNYRSRTNPFSYTSTAIVAVGELNDILDARFVEITPCKVKFDINSQHAATVDILPGFVYKQFTAYLRLGYEQSQYQLRRTVCFPSLDLEVDGFDATIIDEEFVFSPSSRNDDAYRIGLGFGLAATQHLSFHLNYVHTFSEKITYTPSVVSVPNNLPIIVPPPDPADVFINLIPLSSDIIIEPQRNEVYFGVRWTF